MRLDYDPVLGLCCIRQLLPEWWQVCGQSNQHESKQSLDCGTQKGVQHLDIGSMAKVVSFMELALLVNK